MVAINHEYFKPRPCKECGLDFQPNSSQHLFCSPQCKGKYPYTSGIKTTDGQYLKISGDWFQYLRRLTYSEGREHLTADILLEMLVAQDYRCAVTGELLTCELKRGMTFFTNASIDRIIPGGEYSLDNIRLVCRIVNTMKWNMQDTEFFSWCKKVVDGQR